MVKRISIVAIEGKISLLLCPDFRKQVTASTATATASLTYKFIPLGHPILSIRILIDVWKWPLRCSLKQDHAKMFWLEAPASWNDLPVWWSSLQSCFSKCWYMFYFTTLWRCRTTLEHNLLCMVLCWSSRFWKSMITDSHREGMNTFTFQSYGLTQNLNSRKWQTN